MDTYVVKGQQVLRYGYTTGSCAAASAKAATRMLLMNEEVSEVQLITPMGITKKEGKGIVLMILSQKTCLLIKHYELYERWRVYET